MSAKFAFIDAEKALYSIVKMCAWIGVSTSGYYEWRDRSPSATAQRRGHLATLIEWIFTDSDQTYGHRRIHAALLRQGERVTPELVRSIMRELDLNPCQPRPFRPPTTLAGDAGSIPDLVARDFTADAPGTKLVGDITCAPIWSSTPCRWPPGTTRSPAARYSIPIVARNIRVGRSLKQPPSSASADRSDAPGHVSITPSQNPSMPH